MKQLLTGLIIPEVTTELCRVAVDIGGTFTDIVLLWSDGSFATKKVLSTPKDFSKGVADGISSLIKELQISTSGISQIIHATTVATNAILERTGARTALITTKGFRDVLELRRIRIPKLYDLFYEKPPPLVPRRYRLEVDERVDARGGVLKPLNEADVSAAVEKLKAEQVESVAICFLNSFMHPDHERRAGELIHGALPGVYLSLSVDVLPEIREYERTSTTVINAYIAQIVKHYLQSLLARLRAIDVGSPLLVMQSNGGIMSTDAVLRTPAYSVESGPAAGAVATARWATSSGYHNAIGFDMGGTTAKAAMVENGKLTRTTEAEVGGGITLSSRMIKGGGYAMKLPMIDLSEVGAGGGSIARVDKFGVLKVGPESAGADPGPACYDRGGDEPTLTDADLVLGYINPDYLAGGSVRLNSQKAHNVIERKIANPLGKDLFEAAYGMYTISNSTMIRAIKAVSTYRGRDPREFVLFAFGGSGPIHAAEMARSLGIARVVVPPAPGLFSAIGLLLADVEYHAVRTSLKLTTEVAPQELEELYSKMEKDGLNELTIAGYESRKLKAERFADMRYKGQAFELTVQIPDGALEKTDISKLGRLFGDEHEHTYGYRGLDEFVEIVNLRVIVRAAQTTAGILNPEKSLASLESQKRGRTGVRKAYFGADYRFQEATVLRRTDLRGSPRTGPLIIEEYDATVVIPPDCEALLDRWGNIVIETRKVA